MNGKPIDLDVIMKFRPYFKEAFLEVWLGDNWHIYEQFELQVLALIRKGWTHFSSRTVVEELRHYTRHRQKGKNTLKINDHVAPDLARLFTVRYPQYAAFWEYRRPDWPSFLAEIKKLQESQE